MAGRREFAGSRSRHLRPGRAYGGTGQFDVVYPHVKTGGFTDEAIAGRKAQRQMILRRMGIDPDSFNRGGSVRGYNQGGNVDSVHAKLTPGEYVMRRESVRKYGEKFMNDVNLQKLNNGGTVGASTGGTKVSQSTDLERGAKLAGDSILKAFTEGGQRAAAAIKEAMSPENLASQIGDVVGQKMQESIAATSIEMKGNMGVDVKLSGTGSAGDVANGVQSKIKGAIANAFSSRTNVDGSAKDPSLHPPTA